MKATLNRWAGRLPDVSAVLARFPVPAVIMAIFTLIIIFDDAFTEQEQMARLLAGLVISGYLCVSYVLSREARSGSPNFLIQLALTAFIVPMAWFSESLRLNLFMAIGAVILLLGNAALWAKSRDDLHVWDFTHKLWTGVGFAVAGSIIFMIGMFAIQGALKSLFGIDIRRLLENFLIPVGLGFLAPIYWLSTIPGTNEDYSDLYNNPGFVSKAVAFLGTWLLSPLTLIYSVILLSLIHI